MGTKPKEWPIYNKILPLDALSLLLSKYQQHIFASKQHIIIRILLDHICLVNSINKISPCFNTCLNHFNGIHFNSVPQSCWTLCNRTDCSTPGFPVHHQLPELTQIHVHQVGDPIQPSHPVSPPFPPAFNLSQHQGFLQIVLFICWPKYWSFSFIISPSNKY